MSGVAAERDAVNVQDYPPTDLLKLLASLLSQIASTNDALDLSGASTTTTTTGSGSTTSSSSSTVGGLSNGTEHPPIWNTLTTASRTSLSTLSSPLTFHARNVPTISLEAYLLRILKYCPATNDVFLALLVYFDRMAKLSLEAKGRAFVVDSYNVHRLVIAGVTVSSKFFSDVFYTNSRYAKVGGLPQAELNQLELQFLLLNDFRLTIPHEEMQRYAEQLILFSESSSNPSTTTASSNPSSSSSSSSGAAKFVSARKGSAGTDHDAGMMKTSTFASSRSSQVNGPGRPPAAHGPRSRGVYPSSPGSSSSTPITSHRTKSQSPRFQSTPSSSSSASSSSSLPQQPPQAHLSRGHRQAQVQTAMGAMDGGSSSSYGRQQHTMNGTSTPKAEAIGAESFGSPPPPPSSSHHHSGSNSRPRNRRGSSSPENPHQTYYTHTPQQPNAPPNPNPPSHSHPHPSSSSSNQTPSRGHGHTLSTSTSSSFDSDYDSSVCSSAYTTESESFFDDGSFVDEEGETDDETTIRAGSRFSASASEMGERERGNSVGAGHDVQMASPSPH